MNAKRIAATLFLALMITIMVPILVISNRPEPAQAQQEQAAADIVSCGPEGNNIVCRLLDNTIIAVVPIPTVKVPGPTLIGPTLRLPGPTIRIPGPTIIVPGATVTVPGIGATETVRIPGGTVTVTVAPNNPGSSAMPTRTVTISVGPRGTQTITGPIGPTGQGPTVSATITPEPEVRTETETETRTKTETIVRNAFIGLLVSLAIAALGMLAMFIGYSLGQKDAQRNEDKFLEGLLDATHVRKRSD